MPNLAGFWPEERKAALRHLYSIEGKSYTAIAAALGTTPSAIAGQVRRLGLVRAVGAPLNSRQRGATHAGRAAQLKPALAEKNLAGCRWVEGHPTTDPTWNYCGAPIAAVGEEHQRAWCAEHRARVYLPKKASEERLR